MDQRFFVLSGDIVTFAITLRADASLAGAISLREISQTHSRAEMGYLIGKPYWNRGYCTGAARGILEYGFEMLRLNRIAANHFTNNPASGRVMQKTGMTHEGTLRQHIRKWGEYIDLIYYGILSSEYQQQKQS